MSTLYERQARARGALGHASAPDETTEGYIMSDYWRDLANGSQNHIAKQTKDVITIGPASDTQTALDAFQPIANAAIQQAAMDGFHAQTHNSSRLSGLDMIAINLCLD